MRKLGLILLLAALAAMLVAGCGEDETKPVITRLYASETCGIAPLRVDFRADASGGAPLADPTGGNNWLRMIWDFGDGHRIDDGTSIAYHSYEEAGTYTVTVTAEDDNGERATRSLEITVKADSLGIEAFSRLEGEIASEVMACRPLEFYVVGDLCDFDPESDSYERFIFRWEVGDSVYTSPNPFHSFTPGDVGARQAFVLIEDPTRSITRRDTVDVTVTDTPGADLRLASDWLASPQPTDADTLQRDVPAFPDALPYTIVIHNDGPDDASHVGVRGTFPNATRLLFAGQEQSAGTFYFDESDAAARFWLWTVEHLPAGAEATLDVTVNLELADKRDNYAFATSIDPYPCDTDPANNQTTPVLRIRSAPSDLALFANWLQNADDVSVTPDLVHNVPSFPDTLTCSFDIFNSGPSAAFDMIASGTLPVGPQLQYISGSTNESGTFSYDAGTHVWTWNLNRLSRQARVTVNIRFRLIGSTPGQVYQFPANLNADPDDPTPGDHEATATLLIQSVP